MLGKPKYKPGQQVIFELPYDNGFQSYVGEIYIVDPWGTWDDSSDVSYDILGIPLDRVSDQSSNSMILFKHVQEKFVKSKDDFKV